MVVLAADSCNVIYFKKPDSSFGKMHESIKAVYNKLELNYCIFLF